MQPVQDLTVDDRVSRTQFQYTLEDPDANELNLWTAKLMTKLRALPELLDVATDQQAGGLQTSLVIDRVTASRLGITPQMIDDALYDAFGQRQISTLFTQLNQYHVVLETLPEFQRNPAKLSDIYVRSAVPAAVSGAAASPASAPTIVSTGAGTTGTGSGSAISTASAPIPNGGVVPLSAFAHFESSTAPLSVNHQGQFPVVTISFNLAPHASLGGATQAIDQAEKQIGMPPSIMAAFQGTAQAFQASLANEPLLILAAVVTVYIVLGVLYESYIHPITILSTLPSAGVGAILALMIFHSELSVVALIGIILLIGIVQKNAIMMIDFALEAQRKEGKIATDAIYQACLLRFRPIIMTTMAALLGGLPLALGSGTGAELRRPLGIAIVGGLIVSQMLTLYTTPVIYIFFERLAEDISRVGARTRHTEAFGGKPAMNISAPFIRRPVATTLLVVAIAMAGAVAFRLLPVARLPEMDFPTIAVGASLPGAAPEVMASSVATPLERQFGRIAGVTQMTSTGYLGTTAIVLQFDLDRNIDAAARDVQAAINAARGYLPKNLPANPTYRKVNPADAPVLIISLTSDVYGPGRLYDAASTIMQQKLSQIQGVGQVVVGGSSLPAVRVEVNPTQLNSYGLGLEDVRTMLSVQNVNRPKGQISDDPSTTSNLATNDQLLKAADYKPLIVGYHNGSAIALSDVADVQDSVEDIRAAGLMNGKSAVLVIVSRQPGANIIETVDRVKAALPQLKASLPAGIDVTVALDQTTTIRASVRDVERSLLISIALVILVVFVFLRSPRATFIPSIVVPVSLIGTFGVMYLAGYSLDNLSLMALTISTGLRRR